MVDDPDFDGTGVFAGGDHRWLVGWAVAQRVGQQVGQDAFDEGGIGVDLGQFVGYLDGRVGGGRSEVLGGFGDGVGGAERLGVGAQDPCLQPAHVQQVLHQPDELVEGLVGGGEKFVAVVVAEVHVVGAQAADGGLGGGQWGAQVVTDRR